MPGITQAQLSCRVNDIQTQPWPGVTGSQSVCNTWKDKDNRIAEADRTWPYFEEIPVRAGNDGVCNAEFLIPTGNFQQCFRWYYCVPRSYVTTSETNAEVVVTNNGSTPITFSLDTTGGYKGWGYSLSSKAHEKAHDDASIADGPLRNASYNLQGNSNITVAAGGSNTRNIPLSGEPGKIHFEVRGGGYTAHCDAVID